MTRRRYPSDLTAPQKKMMRRIERGDRFEPTGRQEVRLRSLVRRGLLVRTSDSWYVVADIPLSLITYFVQEDYGSIKIGVAASTTQQIFDRLQLAHPRPLKLLGSFPDDRLWEIRRTCDKHHINKGWYKPHADVLAWTKRKDFKAA